jgi:hypothetical protein
LANVVAPDLVMISNEANPAYAAGALYDLAAPFVVNFGNHRGPEPGPWFGEAVHLMDYGPELCVLNFGRTWDTGALDADALLASRSAAPCRVINAFEANAPLDFLNKYAVALIHYAHGPGPDVLKVGAVPTERVGKANSASFRLIRFQGSRPVSYTYKNQPTAPIPFSREGAPPVLITFDPPNDGTHAEGHARFENDLEETFTNARCNFILRRGRYQAEGGRVEAEIESDDRRFTIVVVRFDLNPQSTGLLSVRPSLSD